MRRITRPLLIAASILTIVSTGAAAAPITGAGSTFVYPVLSKWASDFKKLGGDEINYQSIGSGGGIAQIKAGTVDFGATDKPLASDELAAAGLAQFPVVIGGIVPVLNIPGAHPGQVKMSGPVLAGIYAGEIKMWNDPRIAEAQSRPALPGQADHAGAPLGRIGHDLQLHPLSVPGQPRLEVEVRRRHDGVVERRHRRQGQRGRRRLRQADPLFDRLRRICLRRAEQDGLRASCRTRPASSLRRAPRAFAAAAATADWAHAQDFNLVMTNAPGADSYPITASTFVLMHKQPKDADGQCGGEEVLLTGR